eukprot:1431493-Alexandrium_andersonii.AAC.1
MKQASKRASKAKRSSPHTPARANTGQQTSTHVHPPPHTHTRANVSTVSYTHLRAHETSAHL